MTKLKQIAKYIRSKNAGPFWITIDIFLESNEDYMKLKNCHNLTKESIGRIYDIASESIKIFHVDDLHTIKISIPKIPPQGYKYESDMHSGQQYVRMLELDIDEVGL